MVILDRSQIDLKKWEDRISLKSNGFPYASYWHLDIVSPDWKALIVNDYEYVLPLPSRKKWGFSYVFPPEFTQQIGLIGEKEVTETLMIEVLDFVSKSYSFLEFNLNEENLVPNIQKHIEQKPRKNFELDLSLSYDQLFSNFHKNTQRNIKKSQNEGLRIKEGNSLDMLITTFQKNKAKELDRNKVSYELLKKIYSEGRSRKVVELYEVYKEETYLGGALFLNFNQRKVFLFSALSKNGRNHRAMFFLLDEIIKKYSDQNLLLDFEGSDNPALGDFYRRFGAKEKLYLHLKINLLPFYIKWLKE